MFKALFYEGENFLWICLSIHSSSWDLLKLLWTSFLSKHILVRSWFKDRHNNITLSCAFHPILSPSLEQRLLSAAMVPWDSYQEFLWTAVSCLNTYLTHSFSLLGWGVVTASGSKESREAAAAFFYGWKVSGSN